MINEREEFAAYIGTVFYTAVNKNDRTWLGRFTFDMLKEFEGMARVLTILARGYMWEGDEPDCDRARRALCAWCSTPESKNASSLKKSWQDQYSFPELHAEFPELVDDAGKGWLSRHVKALCRFAKSHPDLVDAYAKKDCEILQKSFTAKLRKKVLHYQVPIFSPTTDQAWSLSFDSVIADALELGPLRETEVILTAEERTQIAAHTPVGMPVEMLETLVAYYITNKPEDTDWVVLPVANFDAYFGGTAFSRKYLGKIPAGLIQREKQSYGISRYKMDLTRFHEPDLAEILFGKRKTPSSIL